MHRQLEQGECFFMLAREGKAQGKGKKRKLVIDSLFKPFLF
jgi:hypothetical protein